jgi:hypothetical protein
MHIVKTRRQAGRGATLTTWSADRLTILAVSLCVAVGIVDALLGRHVVLIGLLIVGPCCATLTRRWRRIAFVGAWSVALAVVLGFPDVNFGSFTQLAFLGSVLVVTLVAPLAAAVIEHAGWARDALASADWTGTSMQSRSDNRRCTKQPRPAVPRSTALRTTFHNRGCHLALAPSPSELAARASS